MTNITPNLCHKCLSEDTLAIHSRKGKDGTKLFRVECWACGTNGAWHHTKAYALQVFTTPVPIARPAEPITERLSK